MEIQLQELIEQIKKNGVEQAEAEATAILTKARAEAEKLVSEAKEEAERLLAKAKLENDRITRVSEDAIRQAGRNLLLSFRESVTKELEAVVGAEITAAYSSETVAELIAKVALAWSNAPETDDVSVLLNEKDIKALESSLMSALKAKMLKGVNIKPNDSFDGGFRIAVNNGSVYYDYSAEAVTEMLSAYLTPKVSALMKEAEGV